MTTPRSSGTPTDAEFSDWVHETCTQLGIPGAAIGVFHDGRELFVFHGVTNVDHPLPVDASTRFQIGSITKTFTATAVMTLVESGAVALDDPVCKHLPGFAVHDVSASKEVTVLHLLNHSAGWEGDAQDNTGDGDDAMARFVESMRDHRQITPVGSAVSYNNASLAVAGRLIEAVTGTTYEAAIDSLLLQPLGLHETHLFAKDIMTNRFAVGHFQADEKIVVARPWAVPRSAVASGGAIATAADHLAWARFHLGRGGDAQSAVLSLAGRQSMGRPTMPTPGGALGDAVGIGWFSQDRAGVRVLGHSGVTKGQVARIDIAPDESFALTVMTNSGNAGPSLIEKLRTRALDHFLDVQETVPAKTPLDREAAHELLGRFETVELLVDVEPRGDGLAIVATVAPVDRETGNRSVTDEVLRIPISVVGGVDEARFIAEGGAFAGMRGRFLRDTTGAVFAVDLGGRLAIAAPTFSRSAR